MAKRADIAAYGLSKASAGIISEIKELGAEVNFRQANATTMVHVDLRLSTDADRACELVVTLPNVERLNLESTTVSPDQIRSIAKQKELRWLDLSRTSITDRELQEISTLPRLEFLLLWGTSITDEGLRDLPKLGRLQKLDLSGTQITDAGLVHLETMTQLLELNLEVPALTSAAVDQLREKLPNTLVILTSEDQ